jgi:WD40 repeat protein
VTKPPDTTGRSEEGVTFAAVPGYAVEGVLGKGGMGVVYRAQQIALRRTVALKMILHAEYAGNEERRRFHAEAEAIAQLAHPNIVQVHEVGEYNGLPYFSLEFCSGGSLQKKLAEEPWEALPAARLVETLSCGMHAAHQAGLVHRDLKPANVLLAADGTPKITDFGLVKRLDVPGHTQSGAVMGTPSYMAPEQAAGKSKEVGVAADVYALGAILYQALTGRPPFRAATVLDTLLQVISEEPVPVRRLQPKTPRDLETICHKCLEKDPKKRYTTAEHLAEDLRRFVAGEPVQARPVGPLGRLAKWARRRPAVASLWLAVVLVALGGLAGILWNYAAAVKAEKDAIEKKEFAEGETRRANANARQAQQNAEEARLERDRAHRQAYFAHVGQAEANLQSKDHAGALVALDRIRPEDRGWEYGLLRHRAEGTPLELHGHEGRIGAVAWSPDGTRIATAGWDNTVKVWDAHRGVELATLRGHGSQVTSVSWSPDGGRLASTSFDRTVRIWDVRSGAGTSIGEHAHWAMGVSWSPDGRRIASASADGTVRIWDARTHRPMSLLRGHRGMVLSVSWSSDGSRIASGSEDHTVMLWDVARGSSVATLTGHTRAVNSVCFSPDGTHVASASLDGTVRIWDPVGGDRPLTLKGHTESVAAVSYHPDGSRIASASRDKTVRLWDTATGTEVAALRGHRDRISAVCWSPDGARLASGAEDGVVKVWEMTGADEVPTLAGHRNIIFGVACSPDGSRIASAAGDMTAKIWDAAARVELATLLGHSDRVTAVAFSPDGQRLATASYDRTVKLWDVHTGRLTATLRGHEGAVTCVCWDRDGNRLATGSRDHTVKVWNAGTGDVFATLREHSNEVKSVCFTPDSKRLVSAAQDRIVKIWSADGSPVVDLRGHTEPIFSVAVSPDGSRIASAGYDQTVRIWDAGSGKEVAVLRGHTEPVLSVCFSPDGSRIVSGSWDGTVKVWDLEHGSTATFHSPMQVFAVCCSRSGDRIISASGTVLKVWASRPGSDRGLDFWDEAEQGRAVRTALWHAAAAESAEKRRDSFAAGFHRGRLGADENLRHLAWARLAKGDQAGCVEALRQSGEQCGTAGMLGVASMWGAGFVPQPALPFTAAAAFSWLKAEQRTRAASFIRAAALVPGSGLEAELVQQARDHAEANPQDPAGHELLGAALCRAAKYADAIQELQEANRLRGGEGSMGVELFLAMANQHLGKAADVEALRQKLRPAMNWEERMIQCHLLSELDERKK